MKFLAIVLSASIALLTACSAKEEQRADALLAELPFHYGATIQIGENTYPASIARNETGEVTVTVLLENTITPIVFVANDLQSTTTSGEYTMSDSVEESPAASIAVLLRQALLRLAAEPIQKENNSFVAKSGALSVIIDSYLEKIKQISIPGISITVE